MERKKNFKQQNGIVIRFFDFVDNGVRGLLLSLTGIQEMLRVMHNNWLKSLLRTAVYKSSTKYLI